MAHNRTQLPIRPDVRFGSEADICNAIGHVNFSPGKPTSYRASKMECLLKANSRHKGRSAPYPLYLQIRHWAWGEKRAPDNPCATIGPWQPSD